MIKTITLTATIAVTTLVATAAGAEVPAQYRGLWCSVPGTAGTRYYRCRHATGEDCLAIRRDRINLTEESDCRINAVAPIAKDHRLRVSCPDAIIVVIVLALILLIAALVLVTIALRRTEDWGR
jgi:hypothetical protein